MPDFFYPSHLTSLQLTYTFSRLGFFISPLVKQYFIDSAADFSASKFTNIANVLQYVVCNICRYFMDPAALFCDPVGFLIFNKIGSHMFCSMLIKLITVRW